MDAEGRVLCPVLPRAFSITMYSLPTSFAFVAFHASTLGINEPKWKRKKSIVATSLFVQSPTGPAVGKGMRAMTSRRSPSLNRRVLLNLPG